MQANPFAIVSNSKLLSHAYLARGDFSLHKDSLHSALKEAGINVKSPGHYIFDGGTFAVDDAKDLVAWYHSGRTNNNDIFTISILAPKVFRKDAQQMLLKLFEEAKHPYIFFIFIPEGVEILDTILSRVQIIRLQNENKTDIAKFVKLTAGERIKYVAAEIKGMESSDIRIYTENLVRNLIAYFHAEKDFKKNPAPVLTELIKVQNSLAGSHIAPKFILDYVISVI